jgi:hypothetical protein
VAAPEPEKAPAPAVERSGAAAPPLPAATPYVVERPKPADGASEVVTVDIVLKRKSRCPERSEVTYERALAVYEWEVVGVEKGVYPHATIRIAHPVFWGGKRSGAADFPVGKRWSLDLALLERYPSLLRVQRFDDLEVDYDLDIYIAKL